MPKKPTKPKASYQELPYTPIEDVEPTDRIHFRINPTDSAILKEIHRSNPALSRPGILRAGLHALSRKHGDDPAVSKNEMLKTLLANAEEQAARLQTLEENMARVLALLEENDD